ncbi:MAG: SusD/RagB family nutrient-binding outer membrane lipoprotein [Bacteroidales bacterium]|nr:SusD/RagB family nutrient-binding outer membrane lipoprotein [Bacteroidales bacterium]
MKTILFKGFVVVFAISLVLASCTKDFDKINTNPNEPGLEQAVPKMLLPNAIESMTDRVYEIFLGHEMGNCWVQHMAKVQYTDEDRYIPRISVINNTWSSFYAANGMDIALLKKVSTQNGLDNYKGVALVLEAYVTSVLTDLFGPIPYTEAWRSSLSDGGILSPAYDSQESIYRTLIANLDTANMILGTGSEAVEGDILYDGDTDLWKKFANSLRMRLILRMSDRDATFATTELSKMVADPATYPIMEANGDNAQLVYLGSAPNNNPINENRKTRDDHRVK